MNACHRLKLRIFLRAAAGLLGACMTAGTAFALDWPAAPEKPKAGFGSARSDYLLAQILLGGEPVELRAAEDGEILFMAAQGGVPGSLPFPLGGMVALAHEDGFSTLYSGIEPDVSPHAAKMKKGDSLGKWNGSGTYGSVGPGFAVMDRKVQSWVNPLMLLPALESDRAPAIFDLSLARDGAVVEIAEGRKNTPPLGQGSYDIFVGSGDGNVSGFLSAPFRLSMSLNGVASAERTFDAAVASGEGLAFTGSKAPSGSGIDSEGRFFLGRVFLAKGAMRIRIRAESVYGSVRETTWILEVR